MTKTELCDRCEQPTEDLLPTNLGWLCEDCAWAAIDRDEEGEVYAELAGLYTSLEQHGRDLEAQQ